MAKEELIEDYLNRLRTLDRTEETIRDYSNTLTSFANFIGGKSFDEVVEKDVIKFLNNGKKKKTNSKNEYCGRLNRFYKWLRKQGMVESNPVEDLAEQMKKGESKPQPELSVDDVRKIITTTESPRNRAIVLMLYKTGLRVSELINLNKGDINWETGKVTIRERKGGKSGYVFIDNECMRALRLYLSMRTDDLDALFVTDRRRISYYRVYEILNKMVKQAGYEGVTPHTFRHIFTTHLQLNGCHPEVIRMLRGDRSSNIIINGELKQSGNDMVSYYTHFSDEQVKDWYLKTIPKLYV